METTTTSNIRTSASYPAGQQIGSAATSLEGFYGATPVAQPTNASEAAVTVLTDTSGGTGHLDTGLQALSSSYNSGILSSAISSLALAVNNNIKLTNQLRADLVTLGLIKGS